MIFRLLLLCSLYLSAASYSQAGISEPSPELSQKLVMDVYRPLHGEFAEAAERWASEVTNLCDRRMASSAYKMQSEFTRLLEVFSAIQLFRLGPLLEDNLQNRLFDWPDKPGVVERELTELLNSENIALISPEQLASKSVAVQGFTALERLLFDVSLQPVEDSPQCNLIPVVIQNIANMASQLDIAWHADSDYVNSLLKPHAESTHFRNSDEVLRSVFTQAKMGLDVVLNGKLAPMLSGNQKDTAQAPLWLSQRSVAMIKGNLRGIQGLLLDTGFLVDTRFQEELGIEFEYLDHVFGNLMPIVRLIDLEGDVARESRVLLNQLAAVVARIRYLVNSEIGDEFTLRASF